MGSINSWMESIIDIGEKLRKSMWQKPTAENNLREWSTSTNVTSKQKTVLQCFWQWRGHRTSAGAGFYRLQYSEKWRGWGSRMFKALWETWPCRKKTIPESSSKGYCWCLGGSILPGPENCPEGIQLPGFQQMSTCFPITVTTGTYPHISKWPLEGLGTVSGWEPVNANSC